MNRLLIVIAAASMAFAVLRGKSSGKVEFPTVMMSDPTPVKSIPADQRVRVFLFTGTEWCGACQQLDRKVIDTPAWEDFASKEIEFRAYDFPFDRSRVPDAYRSMAEQYNVRSFPTMLVLDSNYEVLSRQVGAGPPVENWKAWIRGHQQFFRADAS